MSIYNIQVRNNQGERVTLESYQNKVLLIINSATRCGFTKQYDGLQKLYEKYQSKGFEILDFPCNQFLGQAPGKVDHIKEFCELNFGITFTLFDKVRVNGFWTHPLFQYLKKNGPQELGPGETVIKNPDLKKYPRRIKWNFTKFVIDRQGNIVHRFSPSVTPEEIDAFIKRLI